MKNAGHYKSIVLVILDRRKIVLAKNNLLVIVLLLVGKRNLTYLKMNCKRKNKKQWMK